MFFFSALSEESRDWVLSDLDFGPPLAALGGMVVNVLMWMRFCTRVVVLGVNVDVRVNVVFGFNVVWRSIGECSVLYNF